MIEVVTTKNIKNSEVNEFANGNSSILLMEKAGISAAAKIFEYIDEEKIEKPKYLIVCGTGNNAGDGYVIAREICNKKFDVDILLLEEKFSESGLYYYNQCKKLNIEIFKDIKKINFSNYNIIIDCILGVGAKYDLRENASNYISIINENKKYYKIISIDINSGLNSDSGMAKNYIKSNFTISIGNFKTGHFLNMAKDAMIKKTNCDIGINILHKKFYLYEKEDIKKLFPERKNFSNKGSFGKISLIGGSLNYAGAIKLSALALSALKSGAGLATIYVPKNISNIIREQIVEVMVSELNPDDGIHKENELYFDKKTYDNIISKSDVISIGMGFDRGETQKEIIHYIIENFEKTLLLDADALNILSDNIEILKNKKCKIVLTPHIKEFERLFKSFIKSNISKNIDNELFELYDEAKDICNLKQEEIDINYLQKNSVLSSIVFAKNTGVCLLLKGPTTIITDGNQTAFVDRGTKGMATAGSGDVLSGILSGFLGYFENSFDATIAAAYVNGLAGELAAAEYGEISMLSTDTIKNIYKAIKNIGV